MDAKPSPINRYVYETPWPSYSLAWSARPDPRFRFAVGSCIEHEANRIQVIELNEETNCLEATAEVEHPFPPTKLMWRPDDGCESTRSKPDLLASSSTTLNVWKLEEGQVKLAAKLANPRTQQGQSGHLPPLTSFDWSNVSPHKIGTSSVDTTCTIWNLEKQKIETQLIAHDKAVYDIAFAQVDTLFASVGADGSVRLFDQRNLDHSTIIYETSPPTPLLRLAWNKINTNHIATIAMDATGVILIDIRRPCIELGSLSYHESCVNHIAWAPHSRNHLLCGTDDGFALVWDVSEIPPKSDNKSEATGPRRPSPLLAHECDHEVYQVHWPLAQPDYVALGSAKQVEVLQV
mmetsp:Transcript_32204/g.68518  ORF Transcript_32204/g.68518 Transcript_32204/m.68518 type:complete len:348 (+) Transcript_32204:143-1186(+)